MTDWSKYDVSSPDDMYALGRERGREEAEREIVTWLRSQPDVLWRAQDVYAARIEFGEYRQKGKS